MAGQDNQHHKRALRTIAVLAALAVITGAYAASLWRAGAFLPSWVTWSHAEITADLDGDGNPDETVTAARSLSVFDGAGTRCQAPADWFVSDAFVGDVTHDGTLEVVAITWKRGSFGTSKPFWIKRDSPEFSQHVFIFDYEDGQLHPVWMSSTLGTEAHAASLDNAGRLHLADEQGVETIWEWQSWGLVLVDESGLQPENSSRAGNANEGKPGTDASGESDLATEAETSKNGEDALVRTVSLIAVGDVIAHDSTIADAQVADGQEFDFSPLFSRVKQRLQQYDIAVANQETPFVEDPSRFAGYPLFGTPSALGDALAEAGFDVITAATNHANDQGEDGLATTIGFWRTKHPEITLLGLHDSPANASGCEYLERNGIRLALLNATYGLNGNDLPDGQAYEIDAIGNGARLAKQVSASANEADATICFLHIGDEYSPVPSSKQRSLCERLIDAGADAIICTHPHVLQPVELIHTDSGAEGVVFWSLGNFASNQLRPETVLGGCAELTFEKTSASTSVRSYTLIPTACHFERGLTQVYWLDTYPDSLARRHYINTLGNDKAITSAMLREQFDRISHQSSYRPES